MPASSTAPGSPEPAPVVLATDGSCLSNPDGPSGWAWASADGRWASGGMTRGTNNIGELLGLVHALEAHPDTPLVVQLDSAYTLGIATSWAASWEKRGWRKADKKVPENLELVKRLRGLIVDREARGVPLELVKVKGHAAPGTHPLNEEADRRAVAASRLAQAEHRDHEESGTWAGADTAAGPSGRADTAPAGDASPRRRSSSRTIHARYAGTCPVCGKPYPQGEDITRVPGGWGHPTCR